MRFVELTGNRKQNGQIQGEAFKKEIREIFEIRKSLLERRFRSAPPGKVEEMIHLQLERLKKHPGSYEEFLGLSEASQLSLSELAILNNYTDMRDFSYPDSSDSIDDGCSVLSVRGNHIVCGQTWDMHASARDYMTHLEVKGEFKIHILTVTGCVALAGVNERGVAVLINNMHCQETGDGLIWPVLVREMLEKKTAKEALAFIQENLPASGHNYLICDPSETYNVEATGKRVSITKSFSSSDYVFHTNHFVGELKETEILARQSLTTHQRYQTLENLFREIQIEEFSYQKMMEKVFANEDSDSIYVRSSSPQGSETCGGITLDLREKRGELFSGFYSEKKIRPIEW